MQGELSDLNLVIPTELFMRALTIRLHIPKAILQIIDKQNTNSDLNDIEYELNEERKADAELKETVEELFRERREKEEASVNLEERLHLGRQANQDFINNMVRSHGERNH